MQCMLDWLQFSQGSLLAADILRSCIYMHLGHLLEVLTLDLERLQEIVQQL